MDRVLDDSAHRLLDELYAIGDDEIAVEPVISWLETMLYGGDVAAVDYMLGTTDVERLAPVFWSRPWL